MALDQSWSRHPAVQAALAQSAPRTPAQIELARARAAEQARRLAVPFEAQLDELRASGVAVPIPEFEWRFAHPRRWRFDYAWPHLRLAVELEGGHRRGATGHHTSADGYTSDARKYNAAALLSWRVLRYTSAQIAEGEPLADLRQVFEEVDQ